jgi:hypothetical protein
MQIQSYAGASSEVQTFGPAPAEWNKKSKVRKLRLLETALGLRRWMQEMGELGRCASKQY